jgi:hypothetical protein
MQEVHKTLILCPGNFFYGSFKRMVSSVLWSGASDTKASRRENTPEVLRGFFSLVTLFWGKKL